MKELYPDIFTDQGITGCSLADLPPFHWKEVDSGIVDIRAPEEYATQTESLYEAGYLGYQQDRLEFPARYQSIPEMTYEEYLATCYVFPDVDFSKYALLGYHTTGTGCEVTFQKQVTRNDQKKQLLYEVTVVVEGACQKETNNRNLILVPPIAKDYTVTFSKKVQRETARDSNPALMAELVAGSS